jgi:uncharacterized membrane protein
MVEQHQLLFLGSALVMLGLFMLALSIKPRLSGSAGIMLLGPIPIVWGGRNRTMLLIPLAIFAIIFALVILL